MKESENELGWILMASIWQQPIVTKLVWFTMLCMADRNGIILASVPGLAKRAGVTQDECVSALKWMGQPDEWNAFTGNEGRWIKDVPGGWQLLNWEKYCPRGKLERLRVQTVERQAKWRAAQKANRSPHQVLLAKHNAMGILTAHMLDTEGRLPTVEEYAKAVALS